MKHSLLIILSFLLLTSFVTSCDKKKETLYLWETSSGIQWREFGDKETHTKYEGEVENGVPNGLGVMIYTKRKIRKDGKYLIPEDTFNRKYIGEWKDGKWNGQGIYKNENRLKFVGEFKEDKYWKGTLYDIEGEIIGNFENGKTIFTVEVKEYTWKGKKKGRESFKYEGEYKFGEEWNLTIYDKNGNIYEKYVNGKRTIKL